jgi:hypothetical protein
VRLPKPTDGEITFYHDAIKQVLLCADPLIHADHQIMPECMPSHVPAVSEKADEYTPALEKTKPPAAKRARLDADAVESTPKTSRKRCDFVMTFAYDANASLRSMLLSLDVKRVLHKAIKATTPASGAGSKTVAGPSTLGGNKICEGIAQAKKYAAIVLLHLYKTRATDHKDLRTYAAFTNCYAICFICAEISHIVLVLCDYVCERHEHAGGVGGTRYFRGAVSCSSYLRMARRCRCYGSSGTADS